MAHKDHLRKPFFISWKDKGEAGWENTRSKYFRTLNEARHAYDDKRADEKLYAYLGEIGCLANSHGELVIDYITFDTNDTGWWSSIANLGQMNRRGFGISDWYETGDRYQTLAELNWRL